MASRPWTCGTCNAPIHKEFTPWCSVYVEVLGQHAGEYGLVATTDVRDTVFQGDIFAGPLPDEMRATNTVMVQQVNVPAELTATKTAVSTLVSKDGTTGRVNYKWLATFYTKAVADSLIGKPVLNGGGIFGQVCMRDGLDRAPLGA